ncbi:hypothetical protein K439DRAFT_1665383 [Ramaria rubella]|nr:hypothetical protein K439DRAFT_1665383 [Ramaria rubella]
MPRFNFTFEGLHFYVSEPCLWMEGSRFNDSLWDDYSADSFRVTFSEGATATLNFAGTGVSLFGAFRPNHGNFSVNLDHGTIVNGDGNANNIFREPLSQNYNLSNIEHFIQATNEPSSAGEYFDLDYVNIERVIGQDKDTIFHSTIDDTSPFVIYDGPWGPSSVNATSNTNGTLHMTTEDNSQIRIVFQACCIELYGLYTNAQYTVTLDDHSPVPMHGQDIDLDPIFWHPNTLLYLIDGLPEGVKHTVTLNTTSTSLQRPFSFDYGIVRSIHNFDSSTSPFSNPPADATTTPVSPPPGSTIGTKSIMSMDTIVGAVVGTTAFLALILIASWVIRKRCKVGSHGSGIDTSLSLSR